MTDKQFEEKLSSLAFLIGVEGRGTKGRTAMIKTKGILN